MSTLSLKNFWVKLRLKILTISLRRAGFESLVSHLIYPAIISEKSIVADLGGNKGFFSREMAEKFGAMVHYVEPAPDLYTGMKEFLKIKKYNIAISDVNSKLIFYLSNNSEGNSFNKDIAELYGIKEIIKIETKTLGEFCRNNNIGGISLLKIDIEGAEIEVLNSLEKEYLLAIPQITVEFHEYYNESLKHATYDCIKRLKSIGFRKIVFSSESYENTLFLNRHLIKLGPVQSLWLGLHNLFQHNN